MHDRPENPCWEARELYKPQVGYCVCPAYNGEITLIPASEGFSSHIKGVRGFVEIVNDDGAGLEGHECTLSSSLFGRLWDSLRVTRGLFMRPVITVGRREECPTGVGLVRLI
jgi:hypothetical protein